MDDFLVGVLSNIGIVSFVALSAYVLLLSGKVSFGQQAFFAVGAYAAGMATAMLGWPLAPALCLGALIGGAAALAVGSATLRLTGFYFAMATLAFAEMMRIAFELFAWRVEIGGRLVGPNGTDGFGDIRYLFAPGEYRARIKLEMFGDWAVRLQIAGPLRDQLVELKSFNETGSGPPSRKAGAPRPGGHKH